MESISRCFGTLLALGLMTSGGSVAAQQPPSVHPARGADAETAPLPKADGRLVRPGSVQYRSTIQAMGQEIAIDVTRTVEPGMAGDQSLWRVIDQVESPMGAGVDTFELDRTTLKPVRRGAGGAGAVALQFSDSAVTGEVRMHGQQIVVDVRLAAPVFGNESAFTLVIAGLPLAEGYEATLRVFDLQWQRARPMHLAVTGIETTRSAAGTFETFVIELMPLDGNEAGAATMFVMRGAPHTLVRSATLLGPALGDGTAITELVSISPAGGKSP